MGAATARRQLPMVRRPTPDPRSPRDQRIWAIHKLANRRGTIIVRSAAEPIADFTESAQELEVIVNLVINIAVRDDAQITVEFVVRVLDRLKRIIGIHRRTEDLSNDDVPKLTERFW